MTDFDAARFSITVRKEMTEEGEMYVARVAELPDVVVYGDSFEYAYEGAIEVIEGAKEVFDENNRVFPGPEVNLSSEYSGRLPIRTSKTLHRSLVHRARREGISLNAYVNLLLAREDAVTDVCHKIEKAIDRSTKAEVIVDKGGSSPDASVPAQTGDSYVLH